jgi:hypothetical protein
MPNYGHITKSTNPEDYSGGYKNELLFSPRSAFTTIAKPTSTAALGDKVSISTSHTFPATTGFFRWAGRLHSATLKGTTVGDDGAQEIEWTGSMDILGDSASTQEQLQNLLNEDGIAMLTDADCQGTDKIQLGNECVSPSFKVEFDGKTTKDGKKIYTVNITCKKKYFYTGTVDYNA